MDKQLDKNEQKAFDKALRSDLGIDKEELKKMKKKLLKAEGKPERGIETWFRLASKNLYGRLQIVDAKANILITANAIIISEVLGTLYTRLDQDPHLIFAVGGLIITNVLSISYAIIAALPKSFNQNSTSNKVNDIDLMTFDDFYHMSLSDYTSSVMSVVESGNTLYPSIISDIHGLGVVLARKYRLIRISFLVFLYGIIISVMLFGACHLLF